MMFIITVFFTNIILEITTVRYGFKSNGMPGVLYTLLSLSASVFWTLSGIFFLPFENTPAGQAKFLIWNLVPLLPWIFLCRKKYRISSVRLFLIGLSGIFSQAVFLTGVIYLALGENWQKALEYDISRYCGAFLLLFAVPGLLLNSLTFWIKKESWKCPNIALALIAGSSAFFFFILGVGALRLSV